jgi:hypothetical protein
MYPETRGKLLPVEHPFYQLDGKAISVTYRPYAQRVLLGAAKSGRLVGWEIDGRVGVVFSREDLSTGMVGQSVDGVLGYSAGTATDLMSAVVLSVAPKAPVATKPAATTTVTTTKAPPTTAPVTEEKPLKY